ncbi:MAG: transposase, partial [Methylocella sp.]
GRHIADIKAAASLLAATAPSEQLLGDKGYGADHLRLFLPTRGTMPVIPNKTNRNRLYPFAAEPYRLRNIVERTFCRLKDFRAIATRYDKTARNFLAGLCLVTALCSWINRVHTLGRI